VTLEIVTLPVPLFVSDTVWELLAPTKTFPKLTLAGFGVIWPWTPIPVIAIVNGDPGAVLVIDIPPVELPVAAGVNFAVKVVFAPAAIEIGNVNPVTEYPAPDALSAEIVRDELPELFKVTVWEPLLPTETFP
jgi:hypothetical protein